jgi:CRP-like cAMP-binding protein
MASARLLAAVCAPGGASIKSVFQEVSLVSRHDFSRARKAVKQEALAPEGDAIRTCQALFETHSRKSRIAERAVTMRTSALFSGLSRDECLEIASCASARSFERNDALFTQGQPARHLMMIQTGSVKLSQLSPNGNEAILWMIGPGDPLGVVIEALSQSYTCTACAMAPARALVWEYSRFQGLFAEIPQMRKNISQILSNRLEELQERFREVSTEKVAPRVAKALMRLVKQVGKPAWGGIEISLSREELAQMTGTTLFTTSRLLAKWGEEGFVLPRREAVVVLDPQRLAQVSSAAG